MMIYPENRNRLQELSGKSFSMLLLMMILVNATSFFPGILEGDSVLYATIAKRMAQTNDWLNLYADGRDWLDKPHFPFWAAALSFKIFGFSSFAYKLPGFMFWMASLFFTYATGKELYNTATARVATLIFGTSLHVVLSNFDIRAESYLTAFIIAAVYFIIKAHRDKKIKWFIAVAVAAAGAIMTKGIFAGITIGSGYFLYLLFSKQLKLLLNWKWLCCLALIAVFIFPELFALYNQFDLHPEKTVYGHTNVSGLRFFFWDSQLGRFFNTGPIKGKGSLLFFFHTTIWAFLPWSFLFVAALVRLLKKHRLKKITLTVTGSALISFIMFSASGFQLPHYIVIILPHFSLITAAYLASLNNQQIIKAWNKYFSILIILTGILISALAIYSDFGKNIPLLGILWVVAVATLLFYRKPGKERIMTKAILFSAMLFSFLNFSFYPALMNYQAGTKAAEVFNNMGTRKAPLMLGENNEAFELSSNTVPVYDMPFTDERLAAPDLREIAFIPDEYLPLLVAAHHHYTIIKTFDDYRITRLKAEFLHATTRSGTVSKKSLIIIYNQ